MSATNFGDEIFRSRSVDFSISAQPGVCNDRLALARIGGVCFLYALAVVIFVIENPPAAGFSLLLIALGMMRRRRVRVR